MALADSGRGQVLLDLSIQTPDNEVLPNTVALEFLNFAEELPDYASPPPKLGPFEMPIHNTIWHDNRNFWREYAEFSRVNAALIEMKFKLTNRSETSLSNAKLEVLVKPLDGQSFEILAGADLPSKPSRQWSSLSNLGNLPKMLDRREARLVVDNDGIHPVCHVRFGSLLPGEEGRSPDTLAIIPSGPGKLRLHFRILAGELAAPQESEILLETTGESTTLDVDGLDEMLQHAFVARYRAMVGDGQEK
jgi:hypothetical protein